MILLIAPLKLPSWFNENHGVKKRWKFLFYAFCFRVSIFCPAKANFLFLRFECKPVFCMGEEILWKMHNELVSLCQINQWRRGLFFLSFILYWIPRQGHQFVINDENIDFLNDIQASQRGPNGNALIDDHAARPTLHCNSWLWCPCFFDEEAVFKRLEKNALSFQIINSNKFFFSKEVYWKVYFSLKILFE